VSREDLLRLAEGGLAAYPPDKIADLVNSCRDFCRAIPDARYCVLADALKIVADWFEERDRYGGVFTSSVTELNGALQRLPLIVDETEPGAAVAIASDLQAEVSLIVERGEEQLNAMYRDNPPL
jgi:hypothetical protein